MSMRLVDVIKGPIITEKLDAAREQHRQYSFVVDLRATKHDVAHAVSSLFKVGVEAVRTNIVRGKVKRVGRSEGKRSNYKKAIVTLKEGDKIELFEGGAVE
jgi:large subunit ribosomal protein L23